MAASVSCLQCTVCQYVNKLRFYVSCELISYCHCYCCKRQLTVFTRITRFWVCFIHDSMAPFAVNKSRIQLLQENPFRSKRYTNGEQFIYVVLLLLQWFRVCHTVSFVKHLTGCILLQVLRMNRTYRTPITRSFTRMLRSAPNSTLLISVNCSSFNESSSWQQKFLSG